MPNTGAVRELIPQIYTAVAEVGGLRYINSAFFKVVVARAAKKTQWGQRLAAEAEDFLYRTCGIKRLGVRHTLRYLA
jgi:hypothetical protein